MMLDWEDAECSDESVSSCAAYLDLQNTVPEQGAIGGGDGMTDVLQPDRVLDCSGLLCPLPVIRTSKAIEEIAIGQVLKVIATDPGAPEDMEAWARQTGNELIDAHEDNGKYVFFRPVR
jgi:tRNA 2-thiouridine synthesizing protein A